MTDQVESPAGPEVPGRTSSRLRLPRFMGGSRLSHAELEPLHRTLKQFHPRADWNRVERAYEVAAFHHRDQKRRSGEPYITHPLAVAVILAELGMSSTTLAAALLHDTVEDTEYSLESLRYDFGDEVATLVDGVTKLDKVKFGEQTNAETLRKMVVHTARDVRVLIIKLADRLHNMRTLKWMAPDKQQKKSRETLEIFAPLAGRLGMSNVKWELEDLAFATMHPDIYERIVQDVADAAPMREEYLKQVIAETEAELRASKIKATVMGRPKHYYSIYQKMVVRGRDFDEIYDLVGVRVLVETDALCYAALGILHSRWNYVLGRFKDFIANPKSNMYRSLHTTVIGPQGKPVEFQIRTYDMHREAEFGVAAHWRYKLNDDNGRSPDDYTMGLRNLVELLRENEDPDNFLEELRFDITSKELYVFTPKGDVRMLPAGSTPVDFAYAVHTEVGHRCVGARVNGNLVPLESELNDGDTIEIFTSKSESASPSRDWLTFVRSPRARAKIRAWFSKERREDAIEKGQTELTRAFRKRGLPIHKLVSSRELEAVAVDLHYADVGALFAAIGESKISTEAVVRRVLTTRGGLAQVTDELAEQATPSRLGRARPKGDAGVMVSGEHASSDVLVKLARCCAPVPGDDIVGFITRGHGISVHRKDCVNFPSLSQEPGRLTEVRWAPTANSMFLVNIQVEALDRAGLLSDVTRALSDQHVNILSGTITTTRERHALSRFTFEMADPSHLDALLREVRRVGGVSKVYRVKPGS